MTSRVALVGPTHPYKGGIAQHTTQLAHRLAAAGHDVQLISWSEQYPARLYPGEQRVADPSRPETPTFAATTYPLSWKRPDSWWRTGRRLRASADWVVLVVVSPVQVPAYLVLLRALGPDVPVVVLCHNVLPHEARRVDRPLMQAILRRATGVLVHTDAERDRARELAPDATIAVAAMAPHLPGAPEAAVEAVEAGDQERPVRRRLLFFGLVRPYKGLDVLIEALVDAPPDVSLLVAGEFWTPIVEVRARAEQLGVAARVDLRSGYVPSESVGALFAAVDALVLPYRSGTATQNVELAYAHGVPVVVTRAGSLAEAVRHGIDGLVVDPDDPKALAAALRRLYEPGVLQALRAGVRPVSGEPLWQAYVARLQDLAGVASINPSVGRP